MSKLDAAVYDIQSRSLSRMNEQIHKLYVSAEKGSIEEKIYGKLEDIFAEEMDTLDGLSETAESLADDDTDED